MFAGGRFLEEVLQNNHPTCLESSELSDSMRTKYGESFQRIGIGGSMYVAKSVLLMKQIFPGFLDKRRHTTVIGSPKEDSCRPSSELTEQVG